MRQPMLSGLCEAAAERHGVEALAAGILRGGSPVVAAAGCDVAARFRVASVTKPVTAAVVSAVVPLEAPAGVWPGVSVGQLLSHLSGRASEAEDYWALAEVPVLVPPGACWSYSNAGYWLAARLAAEAAGTPYEELVLRWCAEQGLAATDFGEPDFWSEAYPEPRRPSGGLVSTVGDLLLLGEWLAGAGATALRRPVARTVRGVYGLGIAGERGRWGHGGSWGGFEASFHVDPAAGRVFAALAWRGNGRAALHELEAAVLGPDERPAVDVPAVVLAELAGDYATQSGPVRIDVDGRGLVVAREAEAPVGARAVGAATFEVLAGPRARSLFDFPLPGFVRLDSRLGPRVA